jgi:hypothetical protein
LGKYYSTSAHSYCLPDAGGFAISGHFRNPGRVAVPDVCISNSQPGWFSAGNSDASADKFTCGEADALAIFGYVRSNTRPPGWLIVRRIPLLKWLQRHEGLIPLNESAAMPARDEFVFVRVGCDDPGAA